jgi:uncharacterized protein involved in exopolysaccharide biosynthesis
MTDPALNGVPASNRDIDVFQLLTPLVRHWRLMIAVPTACAVLAAAISLIVPKVYTASTSFTPATPTSSTIAASLGGLAGLAGQLGLAGPTGATSPEFFATVVESRELLDTLLRSRFLDRETGEQRPLLDLLDTGGETPEEQMSLGIRRMRWSISAALDGRTGIINVSVRQGHPQLAAEVANRLVELLNEFNLERRQSQSREQLRFTAQRLAEAGRELRQAEAEMQAFLQANRQYRGSPLLEFEYARLERVVQLRQEVYVSLSKAHEDARIAEVRDTPVLTVIDRAVPPQRRTSPHRKLYVIAAVMFGGVIGTSIAYAVDLHARSARRRRPDYVEWSDALTQARVDVRRLLRRGA